MSDVSQSNLATKAISSLNVASAVGSAIDLNADLVAAKNLSDYINTQIENMLKAEYADEKSLFALDAAILAANAQLWNTQNVKGMSNAAYNAAVASAGGHPATAAITSFLQQMRMEQNSFNLLAKIAIDLPQQKIVQRMTQYFNKLYPTGELGLTESMIMYKAGLLPAAYFKNVAQINSSLNSTDAQRLFDIREQQIGKFSPNQAWLAWRRGIITESELNLILTVGNGVHTGDLAKFKAFMFNTPSLLELRAVVDSQLQSDAWIIKKLRDMGYNDEDSSLVLTALKAKAYADEISIVWGSMVDDYSFGITSHDALNTFLTTSGFAARQITAKLVAADASRTRVILKLTRDSKIYLYRQAVITEDDLFAALTTLGLDEEVANAITVNEAAKKGIIWEAG